MARPPVGYIDFFVIGDDRGVQAMLERIDTALSPTGLSAFLNVSVEPWVRSRAKARFKNEGDSAVGRWAPLRPATQEIRSSGEWPVGPTSPINRRTGELEEYITGSDGMVAVFGMGAQLSYPKPSTKKSIIEKMKTAQRGRTSPGTVPRPVLGLDERDLTHVLTSLAFWVKGNPL